MRLLLARRRRIGVLLYYGLPLSMVAAAVLIALGVADRLRDQRLALTDAERRAQTDALTGVLNRRSLLERLDGACLRARARGLPIALLFIDLDHFKQINDSYGHPAGDACLAAIIGPIQAELRQSDVIGRYGGEEFVVILSSAERGRGARRSPSAFASASPRSACTGFGAADSPDVQHRCRDQRHSGRVGRAPDRARRRSGVRSQTRGRNCVQIAAPRAAA